MANPFDQFDAAPASAPVPAGNPFDRFDEVPAASMRGGGQQPRNVPNSLDPGRSAPASFDERFGSGPMASTLDTSDGLGRDLRRVADEKLVGKPSLENQVDAGLFRGANALGLNLPRNAMAAAESVRTGQPFDQSYRYVQDVEDALARQYPKTALAGTVGGVVGGAFALPSIGRVADVGRVGQAALTGGLYGAAGELADSKDAIRALGAGVVGGAIAGTGGYALEKAAPVVARLLNRNVPFRGGDGGLTGEAQAALREAGIDPAAITPELAQHIETAFAAKGASPAAAREAQAAEFGLPLSRGQATGDPRGLALEGRALAGRSGPRAQDIADDFTARQGEAVAATRDRFLGMAAGDAPRVDGAREAFEAAADRARQIAGAQAERESVAQRGVDDALRAIRGRGGPDAIDGAEAAIQGVRDAAGQAKAGYRAAYDEVAQIPGTFAPGALDRLGSRVRDRLGADVPIDPVLTPAASRAIADLDDVPALFNLKPGEGPSLQQVEQLRRRVLAYRGSTGQNPTDRRAVDRILAEMDSHAEDAAAAGLFGSRQAAGSRDLPADGFPGFAGPSAGPGLGSAAGAAPARTGEPESLTRFLARTGGVPLDAEARAADLHRMYVPGNGTMARNGAPSWDQIRVRLAEEGFLPPGMDGAASARDVADWARQAIHAERVEGRPTVRMGDEAAMGGRRAAETVEAQNADHAVMVDRQARKIAVDLEGYGIGPRDIDRAALNDAAEHMVLGRHTDPVDAYEAALSAREAGSSSGGRSAQAAPEIPFDGPTARATSDALPIGDTAPLAAMQRARGLFREYKQAFSPRFAGDAAGNNLRRILERDASPNEVAGMLFGSPGTGRVTGGQVQTLARLREAVGADSEPWRAVQGALVSRHLGGEGRDLGARLDYLLSADGRPLMSFLSGQQQQGLRALKGATRQLEAARQPMPAWIADLERTGFDPNAVGRSIFGGSGAIGVKPGAVLEAQAARGLLGPDSAEWAGIRQAAVHRLLDPATPAVRMVADLRGFTDGAGKGVASALFSPEELGHFRRLAGALQATVRPDGTLRPEASGAAGKAVAKAMDLIAGAIAFKVGGLPAAAGTYGAKVGQRAIVGGIGSARARASFEGGAPRALAPPPMLPLGQLATGEGLALGQR